MKSKKIQLKIKIPNVEYEGMFERTIVKSSSTGVVYIPKKYIGKEVVILVKKDFDLLKLEKENLKNYKED